MHPSQSSLPAEPPPCPSFLTATTIALPLITKISLVICAVKIAVSSVPFAFYIEKGEKMSCFHRVQCECCIIPRKPVANTTPSVNCFLLTEVSYWQSSLFFCEEKRVLIPLLYSIKQIYFLRLNLL